MTMFQGPASVQKSVEDFLGSGQNETAVRAMFDKATPLLADGEQVEHILVQRMTGLKFPEALVLTNRRALLLDQGLLLKKAHSLPRRQLQADILKAIGDHSWPASSVPSRGTSPSA